MQRATCSPNRFVKWAARTVPPADMNQGRLEALEELFDFLLSGIVW